jgi:enamine deaminase RidA (YjgF/YER057c/UK114 family)
MIKLHNPSSVAAPASFYSHAAQVGPNTRWLHISGQVGVTPDGTLRDGVEAQNEQVWHNIISLLSDADMTMKNLVIVRALLVDRAHLAAYRTIRDRFLEGHQAASTLFIVAGLADPRWLIEIEGLAAAEV